MAEWFSIEVSNARWSSATGWMDAFGDDLVTTALHEGASGWELQRHPWGVVIEIEFGEESAFERYRALPLVTAALDNVPDPVNGLFVHRGRGGSAGSDRPRRRPPLLGSGAAALPMPDAYRFFDDDNDRALAFIGGRATTSSPRMRLR
jgi:hypothetical protein